MDKSEDKSEDGSSLVSKLRAEFRKIAVVGHVYPEEFANYLRKLAEINLRRTGKSQLTHADKQAIALRATQMISEMALTTPGLVNMEEWIHYMVLTRSGFAGNQINTLLRKAVKKNNRILYDLQRSFERADLARSGTLTLREVMEMYSQKIWHIRNDRPNAPLSDEEVEAGVAEKLARDIIKAMDFDGDERISYPEFIAYCLGRRKHEVLLHIYDLSNGAAEALSPWVVGKELKGIWHTGVVVFGKEYYYSKDTVFDVPGATSFGKPTQVLSLGYTLWKQDELHEYVVNELKPLFHRNTYDVVTNNCNHFTDRVCMYLLGRHVPEEVMLQPNWLLQSRFVRILRPLLNWWLRDRVAAREKGKDLPPGRPRLKPGDRPTRGQVVYLHPTEAPAASSGSGKVRDSSGSLILARVTEPGEKPARSSGWSFWDSCSVQSAANCGSAIASSALLRADTYWVQYFEYTPVDPSGSPHGRIVSELVHCSRLSLMDLDEAGEVTYASAMRGMGIASTPLIGQVVAGGASRGLSALRVPVPDSMHTEVALDAPCMAAEERALEQLVDRGFNEKASEKALYDTGWNGDTAIDMLKSGPDRAVDGRLVSQL